MPINVRKIVGYSLITLAVVGIVAVIGYVNKMDKGNFRLLTANIINNADLNPQFDPFKSSQDCSPEGSSSSLEISGGSGTYTWSVAPEADVLSSTPEGVKSHEIVNTSSREIFFTAPSINDVSAQSTYIVTVIDDNDIDNNANFTINIRPPCVTGIDFVDPNGAVTPQNGVIEIDKIHVNLSNGSVVEYDASQMADLPISFSANPSGSIQFIDNKIMLSSGHGNIDIYLNIAAIQATGMFALQSTPLSIVGSNCENLQTSIYQGRGQGFYSGSLASLPKGSKSKSFDFQHTLGLAKSSKAELDFYNNGISNIIIENPFDAGTELGQRKFKIDFGFDDQITKGDFIVIENNAYDYTFTIGAENDLPAERAANLINAINNSSYDLPFTANIDSTNDGIVNIASKSKGGYTNNYTYKINDNPENNFTGGSYDVPITSIIISNPLAGVAIGSDIFELKFDFIEGLSERAELKSRVNSNYEIAVRAEFDPADTASNFAYAVNNLLGENTPFVAYTDVSNNESIVLHSIEVGSHTNNYLCSIDGRPFTHSQNAANSGKCFFDGSGLSLGIIDPPRPIDPIMKQGETRTIYSRGGIATSYWRSSDASIIGITPLSEVMTEEVTQLNNENITIVSAVDLNLLEVHKQGAVSVSGCTYEVDDQDPLTIEEMLTCNINITSPVTYPESNVSIQINTQDGVVPGTMHMSGDMTGTLVAAQENVSPDGGSIIASGTLSVPVTGDAIGTLNMEVQVRFDIEELSGNGSVAADDIDTANLTAQFVKGMNLIPTIDNDGDKVPVVSTFAILTAKRPGRTTIFTTDAMGCTAPLEVEVLAHKLFVGHTDPNEDGYLDIGENIQLRAWAGFEGEIDTASDLTNQVRWESDNTEVVIIDQNTGRVTAVAPGTANIYAHYDTDVAETGTLVSENSVTVHVNRLTGITISLDQESVAVEDRQKAFQSMVLAIHSADVAGRSIVIEGKSISIEAQQGNNAKEQIAAITADLKTKLADDTNVSVTISPNVTGALIIEPTDGNENNMVDITTTATQEEISILPYIRNINLPTDKTYSLIAVGEYENGLTRHLPASILTWLSQPMNILDEAALESGLLKHGELAGTTVLTVQMAGVNQENINTLNVNIAAGPAIEFIRRIGADNIIKGSRIHLQVKVSDVDTIEDIQEITTAIVRSDKETYEEIIVDRDNTTWFDVIPFIDEIEIATSDDAEEGSIDDEETLVLNYRTYDIPVAIPTDSNIFDGQYKLVISITDTVGHTVNEILEIYIGEITSGDISGDGKLDLIDVIMAVRIYGGASNFNPTQQQLQAMDMDGSGSINLTDVILLLQKIRGT